ncbi:hypothetical protein [Paremcibacter congregatus]|uniref:hypothetical protein n=1 Tax=Paremcibacter congregatus TaxID=2043170 RepID=UPI0010555D79|nr:hypothetical protein [Paremcibacter congregatus]QDE25898.1 hypothetical protein FIV45_00695 [Paremcibacter congregatus]
MRRTPQAERHGKPLLATTHPSADEESPSAAPEKKMVDQMLADMMSLNVSGSSFKDKKFKFHHTDPATGTRKVMELGG